MDGRRLLCKQQDEEYMKSLEIDSAKVGEWINMTYFSKSNFEPGLGLCRCVTYKTLHGLSFKFQTTSIRIPD